MTHYEEKIDQEINKINKILTFIRLEKKNRTLIERLAQKQYLKALEPVLEQELIHLKKLKDYYSQDRKGQVYDNLSEERKEKGTLIYWEHAGKVDDPRYSDEFVRKVNAYIKEDILPGKNLIITYETTAVPLNVDIVRRMIHRYF